MQPFKHHNIRHRSKSLKRRSNHLLMKTQSCRVSFLLMRRSSKRFLSIARTLTVSALVKILRKMPCLRHSKSNRGKWIPLNRLDIQASNQETSKTTIRLREINLALVSPKRTCSPPLKDTITSFWPPFRSITRGSNTVIIFKMRASSWDKTWCQDWTRVKSKSAAALKSTRSTTLTTFWVCSLKN